MRSLLALLLAVCLILTGAMVVSAQSDSSDTQPADAQSTEAPPADEPAPPTGPSLQPADYTPVICDPADSHLRYLEVRGTGFDAWATQRLVGNLLDSRGVPEAQWGSVWVSPQGQLTLEVNLCADPFRGRGALPAGDYTVAVGAGSGPAIAATSISLAPPPEAPADVDVTAPDDGQSPSADNTSAPGAASTSPVAAPSPSAAPMTLPNISAQPTPTPLPIPTLAAFAPTPTPTPRTGLGTRQQPYPAGAPGMLDDGWQLIVTGTTPDAWSGIHFDIPSSVAPPPDETDDMVRVQATYQGPSTGVFTAMRLALITANGTVYDQLHNSCGIVPDMVPPNLMTPGGSVRGNTCFTVRRADLDSLLLFDNQSDENDRVYFALK